MLLSCSIMKYSDILSDSNAVWIMRITVSFNRQGDRKLCWISYIEGITWSRNGIREILLVFSLNDSWNSTDEIMSWRRRTSGKVRISHSRMWHLSEICTPTTLKIFDEHKILSEMLFYTFRYFDPCLAVKYFTCKPVRHTVYHMP